MTGKSPRWVMRLPATLYGLVWILFGIIAIAEYAWFMYGPLHLHGKNAHLVGFAAFMLTTAPFAILLIKSRFRVYALKWERYADLKDAEDKVARLLDEYARTRDEGRIRKAARVVKKLRRRHPDPTYGQELADRVAAADTTVSRPT